MVCRLNPWLLSQRLHLHVLCIAGRAEDPLEKRFSFQVSWSRPHGKRSGWPERSYAPSSIPKRPDISPKCKHGNEEHVHLGIARNICLFLGAKVEYLRKFINLTTLVIAVPVPISYIAIKQKVTHNLLILVCTKRECVFQPVQRFGHLQEFHATILSNTFDKKELS